MPKATAIFDGDDSRLQAVILNIDRKLAMVQAKFARVSAALAGVAGVGVAVAVGAALGIKSVLDVGGELSDLSANTGIAVDDLIILQQEFRNAGKAAEDVGPTIAKMQRVLMDGSGSQAVADLGLQLEDLQKLAPEKQFRALGEAIAKLPSPAARTAAAMALFGRTGATRLAIFASRGFGDAAAQVGEQAEILKRDAMLFDDVGNKLNLAGLKMQGFFVGMAERVVPLISVLADLAATLDLAPVGQQLGDVLAGSLLAIATGDIWELMGANLLLSLGTAVNGLTTGLLSAVGLFGAALTDLMGKINALMVNAFLAVVEGFDALPGVKGYVHRSREELNRNSDATDATRDVIRGIGKYGKIIPTDAISGHISDLVDKQLKGVAALSMVARALHGGTAGTAGDPDSFLGGGGGPNVSALQRIGGAFDAGGGGGDPLLDENRRHTQLLQTIADRLMPAAADAPSRHALIARYT